LVAYVHTCHMHHVYSCDTMCSTPQKHGCRGAPSLNSICEFWPLMPIWEFISLFTYLGGVSTPMAWKSQFHFKYCCKL
jgi:hypothetical protein